MHSINMLLKRGAITSQQLEDARQKKRGADRSLLDCLIDFEHVDENVYLHILSEELGFDSRGLKKKYANEEMFNLLPLNFMRRHSVCPLDFEDNALEVAMRDPTDILMLDMLKSVFSCDVKAILASQKEIFHKIDACLMGAAGLHSSLERVKEFSSRKIDLDDKMIDEQSEILNADRSPVVELVNNLIYDGVEASASDIHIEPLEKSIEVRYRVDGKLRVKSTIPKSVHRHIISRIKIMASLDITETRRPQDGRIKALIPGKNINLRVSTIPTIFGEKVVLRVLDPGETDVQLTQLGLDFEDLLNLQSFIKQPQGMVLVCGPTGSGKTTTLYSALKEMRSPEKNIVTVEDPVEYTIEGINQVQVNEKAGVTFATGLRTILRQDPDSVLVGEIRDYETAQIAFRASLTGHLVLSSLHTNGAIESVTRLIDMGIEPFILASSLLGVVSQRLLRLNCAHCKEEYVPPAYLVKRYEKFYPADKQIIFYKGKGCEHCLHTGYKGRIGVFEFLAFSPQLKKMISNGATESQIRDFAIKNLSFKLIAESGVSKVVEGLTTLEEMESVLGRHEDHFMNEDGHDDAVSERKDFISDNFQDFLKKSFVSDRVQHRAGFLKKENVPESLM